MIFVTIMVGMIVIELESFDDFDVIIIYTYDGGKGDESVNVFD